MYCMKCGQKLPEDAGFCFRCGVAQQPESRDAESTGPPRPSLGPVDEATRELTGRLKPAAAVAEEAAARALDLSAKGLSRLATRLEERRQQRGTDENRVAESDAGSSTTAAEATSPGVGDGQTVDARLNEFTLLDKLILLFHQHDKKFGTKLVPFNTHLPKRLPPHEALVLPAAAVAELFVHERLVLDERNPVLHRRPRYLAGEKDSVLLFACGVDSREPLGHEQIDATLATIAAEFDAPAKNDQDKTVLRALTVAAEHVSWTKSINRLLRAGLCERIAAKDGFFGHEAIAVLRDASLADALEARMLAVVSGERRPDAHEALIVSLWYADTWLVEEDGRFGGPDFKGPRIKMNRERRRVVESIFNEHRVGQAVGNALYLAKSIIGEYRYDLEHYRRVQ